MPIPVLAKRAIRFGVCFIIAGAASAEAQRYSCPPGFDLRARGFCARGDVCPPPDCVPSAAQRPASPGAATPGFRPGTLAVPDAPRRRRYEDELDDPLPRDRRPGLPPMEDYGTLDDPELRAIPQAPERRAAPAAPSPWQQGGAGAAPSPWSQQAAPGSPWGQARQDAPAPAATPRVYAACERVVAPDAQISVVAPTHGSACNGQVTVTVENRAGVPLACQIDIAKAGGGFGLGGSMTVEVGRRRSFYNCDAAQPPRASIDCRAQPDPRHALPCR
jgi:hypothetical protein